MTANMCAPTNNREIYTDPHADDADPLSLLGRVLQRQPEEEEEEQERVGRTSVKCSLRLHGTLVILGSLGRSYGCVYSFRIAALYS